MGYTTSRVLVSILLSIIFIGWTTLIAMPVYTNVNESLSFFTWNLRANFPISKPFLIEFAYGCDFICLNDHGLYDSELHKIEDLFPDYTSHAKASRHLNNQSFGHSRGFGGCALLWKKSLQNRIRPLPDKGTDRICVVQLTIDSIEYFIVGVYLPHQNCKIDSFRDTLQTLCDLCIEFNSRGFTVIMGDTNCHFGADASERSFGITTPHAKLLRNMLFSCNMSVTDLSEKCIGPSYTWMSDNGHLKSYIDHFMLSNDLFVHVVYCEVLLDDTRNVSDHLAMKLVLNLQYSNFVTSQSHPQVAWHKAPKPEILSKCTLPTEQSVKILIDDLELKPIRHWDEMTSFSNFDVESLLYNLSQIMIDQADLLPKSKFVKYLKPYWNPTLKELNSQRKLALKNYENAGKPKDPSNTVYQSHRDAKRKFRAERRRTEFNYERENMEKLARTGQIDQRFFWFLVNKKRKKLVSPIYSESGELLTQPDQIRREWTEYFRELFAEKIDPSWDSDFRSEVDDIINNINLTNECVMPTIDPITNQEVLTQINKMPNGKSAGYDNVSIEHYRYGGESVINCVTWIVNYVVFSGKIPKYCKKGILIPIPKSGKDSAYKDNNRGLTLMPVIYKIIEKVMIERESPWLHDPSVINHIQSAGQLNCSSLHTSFLTQESSLYFSYQSMTVIKLFMDAHKAFDTVWVKGLLYKLYQKGLNFTTWRLIQSGYDDFYCAVRIGNEIGEYFVIYRGVHQGAPWSMWLYMIFVNDLIEELCTSGYGICINNIDLASPAHADDITLIAIYKTAANELLRIALLYSQKWQYLYNEGKTKYMLDGIDKDPNVVIMMGNTEIECVKAWKHVGIVLTSERTEHKKALTERINTARSKLLASKGLGSHNIPVPVCVMNKLYWSVVVPSLTYGFDVLPLDDSDMAELECAHRKNAKIVSNVSFQVSTPSPLAPIGWMSMKGFIMMNRILFMFRLLCMERDNVYKRMMIFRLDEIIANGQTRRVHRGPVDLMYDALDYYGLRAKLIPCVRTRAFGELGDWKKLVKSNVWNYENLQWVCSCYMYESLRYYRITVTSIKLHPWWDIAKHLPHLQHKISGIMSILMGSEPIKLHCNFKSKLCGLCGSISIESVLHILFGCPELGIVRFPLLENIRKSMPTAMCEHFDNLIVEDRLIFLLSAMHCSYTREWTNVYRDIVIFVDKMYQSRYKKYEAIDDRM